METDYPDSLKGWIRKKTVFPDNWAPLPALSVQYEFEKVADDYGNLLALRITDKKSGKLLQIIGPLDNRYRSLIFEACDYNNDGQTDFCIRFTSEEDTPNPVLYLFDKHSQLFIKAAD